MKSWILIFTLCAFTYSQSTTYPKVLDFKIDALQNQYVLVQNETFAWYESVLNKYDKNLELVWKESYHPDGPEFRSNSYPFSFFVNEDHFVFLLGQDVVEDSVNIFIRKYEIGRASCWERV